MHISMFGAVPDNPCSDQFAFEAAAQWFNTRGGNGELIFGDGQYLVGQQDPGVPPAMYRIGRSPLHFTDCMNLTLVGSERTRFTYSDCLLFGAFDHTNGDALIYPCGVTCAAQEDMATIGICIHLERCAYVSVRDLTLDGNMNNARIGGATHGDGTQIQHTGIVLDDSWEVSLDHLNVFQFCFDGMYILAHQLSVFEEGADMRIGIHDCHFSRNGRNGLSWIAGAGVDVTSCAFEQNGNYLVRSQPGAGVDIEYHDFVNYFDSAPIGHGSFTSCIFKYNKGFGLTANVSDNNAYLAMVPGPFRFTSCTFIGSEGGVALWPNSPQMRFQYCRIHGRTVHPFDCQRTGDLQDRTQFDLCDFDETYYDPAAGVRYSMSWHSFDGFDHLIQADVNGGHGGLTLNLCNLRTYCRLMPFAIHGGLADPGQPNYHAMMLGCTYSYEGAHQRDDDLPEGEYTIGYCQLPKTEVDVLGVRYPAGYTTNLDLLCAEDLQIWMARDHASWPADVVATCTANVALDPQPPSAFPFYGICPVPYLDPTAAYFMCTRCEGGCSACVHHIPPPPYHACELAPEKSYHPEPLPNTWLREKDLHPNIDDVAQPNEFWVVSDLLGRRVGDYRCEQERLAVIESLAKGPYLLFEVDRMTGRVLGRIRFFRP